MKGNLFLIGIFLIGLVSGVAICIDNLPPSPPSNLSVSGMVGEILLEWGEATDEPECSGIAKYVINRDGEKLGEVDGDVLSFIDVAELHVGDYNYTVYAVDKAGHNAGDAIKNTISVYDGGRLRVSGGDSFLSFVCYENWNCSEWSECIANGQRRICEDLNKCGTENEKPIEFRECGLESEDSPMLIEESEQKTEDSKGFLSFITGGAIGAIGTPTGIGIIFILLVSGALVLVVLKRKRTPKKTLKKSKIRKT